MTRDRKDPCIDMLLDMNNEALIVNNETGHWVNFRVTQVPASSEKPHGLDYSLTLHEPNGLRTAGFDNAHPVGKIKRGEPLDHMHRRKCSGQFVIRLCRTCHEFERFRVFNHSKRYDTDMGMRTVSSCEKESSEAT